MENTDIQAKEKKTTPKKKKVITLVIGMSKVEDTQTIYDTLLSKIRE